MIDELKTLIIAQLKSVFPGYKVYDEDVQQGLIAPAFILRTLTSDQERKLGINLERTYPFVITFFPLDERSYHSECDLVNEKFYSNFLYIAERFHVHNIQSEKHDRTLIITFSIKVYLQDVKEDILMANLEVL